MVVRVADDDAVGFVAAEVEVVAGRFVAIPRLGGTFSFLLPFAASLGEFSFSVSVSISEAIPVVSSPDNTSTGVSS